MEENQFYAFIDKLKSYTKLQRLYYEHNEGYVRLGQKPQDFEALGREAQRHLENEYESLSDNKWKEHLVEYNRAFLAFKKDYLELSIKYAKKAHENSEDAKSYYEANFFERLKTISDIYKPTFHSTKGGYLISSEYKLFIQSQSSVRAYNAIQKSLKKWNEVTFGVGEIVSAEKEGIETDERQQKAPQSLFPKASRIALFDDLKDYVEPDKNNEYPELHALIFDGIVPESPIVVDCEVKVFGQTFYEAGAVRKGGAEVLSEQLLKLFQRIENGKIVDFVQSYLVKTLRKMEEKK